MSFPSASFSLSLFQAAGMGSASSRLQVRSESFLQFDLSKSNSETSLLLTLGERGLGNPVSEAF